MHAEIGLIVFHSFAVNLIDLEVKNSTVISFYTKK